MKASKTLKTTRINNRIKSLLFEAYRRNEMTLDDHEKSKPLSQRWLGLGTAAAYRPVLDAGLMRFFDGEIPYKRSMGWLCLTELGIEEMQKHEIEFKISCRNSIYNHYSYGYMMANGMTSTKKEN